MSFNFSSWDFKISDVNIGNLISAANKKTIVDEITCIVYYCSGCLSHYTKILQTNLKNGILKGLLVLVTLGFHSALI